MKNRNTMRSTLYGLAIGLAFGMIGYSGVSVEMGEWSPLKWAEIRKIRQEQSELRKERLGPLAGPVEIDAPYLFKDVKAYGKVVGREADYEATNMEKERVEKMGENIFGKNGYADLNKNGKIDLDELADAYVRMGLNDQVMRSGRFPDVRAEHLERAVKSYQEDS